MIAFPFEFGIHYECASVVVLLKWRFLEDNIRTGLVNYTFVFTFVFKKEVSVSLILN